MAHTESVIISKETYMHTTLTLVKRTKLGLETYEIRLNNRCLHSFLSERHAKTRFIQLKQKLSKGL